MCNSSTTTATMTANSSILTDLIVDFPQRRGQCGNNGKQHQQHADEDDNSKRAKKAPGVHFAQEYEIRFFEKYDQYESSEESSSSSPDNDNNESMIWYKSKDYKAMRLETKRAARDAQKSVLKIKSGCNTISCASSVSTASTSTSASSASSASTSSLSSASLSSSTTSNPNNNNSNNDKVDSHGIENLLSAKIIKKTRASRIKCWRAVLDEQDRQESLGIAGYYDPIALRNAVIEHSEWSSKRAHTIALLQSRV